jgi:hypothetical protein
MEHPHADIFRAIADGKTIQWKAAKSLDIDKDTWEDIPETHVLQCLAQYLGRNNHHFRIKPETKTGWIILSNIKSGRFSSCVYPTKQEAELVAAECEDIEAIKEITYTPGEGL